MTNNRFTKTQAKARPLVWLKELLALLGASSLKTGRAVSNIKATAVSGPVSTRTTRAEYLIRFPVPKGMLM
jgi:hypothetical protein